MNKLESINSVIAGNQMTQLGKMVSRDKNSVEATRFKEIDDEVIRDTSLRDIENRDRCKLTHTLVLKQLRLGVEITKGNILFVAM